MQDIMSGPGVMITQLEDPGMMNQNYLAQMEQSLMAETQQQNMITNDFIGHNRDIIEKFKKYDVDRRQAFSKLRDVLISMASEKRKFNEDQRRNRLLQERQKWDIYRDLRNQLEREVKKIQDNKRGCQMLLVYAVM